MSAILPDFGGFRRIVQSPGTVTIFYDVGQGQGWNRVIPVDGSPHLASHVRQWWGFESSPLVVCEIDLRVGGSWSFVTRDPDGTELGWHGTYQEIVPPERLVSTEVFDGFPDAASLNTTTLTEHEGVTTLTTLVLHSSREHRDGHIGSGIEAGMQHTFDRLARLLEGTAGP